jgi:hypothetical protein
MIIMLAAIIVGAYHSAPPILLAVGFVGEIILVATAHLSSVIEHYGAQRSTPGSGNPER